MTAGAALDSLLGHAFANESLRIQALTHRSYGTPNNERLEFLGDAVLNCVIAAELFERHASLTEGELSRIRANLVREPALAAVAQALGLGTHLLLGEGEKRSGGRDRVSILADAVEALIGAVFLDSGFPAARGVIQRLWAQALAATDVASASEKDAKTALQEFLQGRRLDLPRYELVASRGAAHSHIFEVACHIAALGVRATGEGTSRRAAEQAAAQSALEALRSAGHS